MPLLSRLVSALAPVFCRQVLINNFITTPPYFDSHGDSSFNEVWHVDSIQSITRTTDLVGPHILELCQEGNPETLTG